MRIHHLNCGSLYPLFPPNTRSILYCLLVETAKGLLLVDTGFGIQDYQRPTRFIKLFTASLGMKRELDETAAYQVEKLGFSREDVRHIVLTHMHCDHAGGLRDFPDARVHLHAPEYEAIQNPVGFKERFYEPAHWSHNPKWEVYSSQEEEDWFSFRCIRVRTESTLDVRLIPLTGHTRGHCGVAIKTHQGWLLHCGDATFPFYHKNEPAPPFKPLPSFVMAPPKWLEKSLIGEQTTRLRELHEKHSDTIEFICSNDSITFSMKNR
jgi:glyoxylase-like metal-dependent hydrolase (beta-lactamase superfamily II)